MILLDPKFSQLFCYYLFLGWLLTDVKPTVDFYLQILFFFFFKPLPSFCQFSS